MKGHVYLRGKTYTYVFDLPADPLSGERSQKSKGGFKTEKEAWSACRKAMSDAEKGLDLKQSKITLAEYLMEYLETHAKPNFKPTSYDTEKTIIEARIIPALGKIKLQSLTPRTIKSFYAELRTKYSKDYVKNIHGVLKRALRLAYTESGIVGRRYYE